MKSYILFIFSLFFALVFSTCQKDEVLKDAVRVYDDGLVVKFGDTFAKLDDAQLVDKVAIDTTYYEGQKIPVYNLTVTGDDSDKLVPGSILIDNSGSGAFYFIIQSTPLKSANGSIFQAIIPSLDFLFNYEGARIKFSSPENRAKRNSNISGKINTDVIQDDKDKAELDHLDNSNEWTGYSHAPQDGGIGVKFKDAKIALKTKDKGKDDNTSELSLTLEADGYVNILPAIDFEMVYNPEYFKTSDDKLVAFFQDALGVANPSQLLASTALTLGTLKQLKTIIYTNLDYGLNLNIEIEGSIETKRNLVAETYLFKSTQYYPTPVYGLPISHQTKCKLVVDVELASKLSADYFYQKENDVAFGFDLRREDMKNAQIEWYEYMDSRTNKGGSFVAEVEVAAGIKFVIESDLYFCSIVGPSVKGSAYVKGGLDMWYSTATNQPGWEISVDAGIKGGASVDLSMFHFDKLTWEVYVKDDFKLAEWNLYKCPYKVVALSGDKQTGRANEALSEPLVFQVLDNLGNLVPKFLPNVPVFIGDNRLGGYNGTVPEVAVITDNSIGQTTWSLDNEPTNQKLLVTLRDEVGELTGESLEFEATLENETGIETGTVTDYEGNIYKTVKIGAQWWMAENLKSTKYNDGNDIPLVDNSNEWIDRGAHGYCWYNNDKEFAIQNEYGALYNWQTVDSKKLCPSGWHVPSNEEWDSFDEFVSNDGYEGTEGVALKSQSGWYLYAGNDVNGIDKYGFKALPAGYRKGWEDGFQYKGVRTDWWSSTQHPEYSYSAFARGVSSFDELKSFYGRKSNGYSVRCIKD